MKDFPAQKTQIILDQVISGKLNKAEAARELGVSRKTIYKWLERYSEKWASGNQTRGDDGRDTEKSGKIYRKRNAFKKDILRVVTANPRLGPKKISERLEKKGKKISVRSVWLVLKELGLQTRQLREDYVLNFRACKQAKEPDFPIHLRLTPQARKRIVEDVLISGEKVKDITKRFCISRKTFAKWKKRYQKASGAGENILLALSDQHPEGPAHPRGASEAAIRAVLNLVVSSPELSSHKIAKRLRFIGNHGIQNIFERRNLNRYELRLAYSQAQKAVPKPVFTRFIDRVRYVLEQFVPSLAPAPPPLRAVLRSMSTFGAVLGPLGRRLLKPFFISSIFIFLFSYGTLSWVRLLGAQTLSTAIGLIFASIALLMGSFFFLYSFKYYITLALVLSFSQQEVGERSEGGPSASSGFRKKRDFLSLILGLNGPSASSGLKGAKKAVGLTPNLEHVKLKRYPYISVHIPFYNEKNVVERSIKAATNFDYPEPASTRKGEPTRGGYEVILCDDSTDETTEIIRKYMKKASGPEGLKARRGDGYTLTSAEVRPGVTVKHLHRTSRSGYKGGALRLALKLCDPRTEFISVFDADFVPYPDTLELFLKYFQVTAGTLDFRKKSRMINDQWLMAKKEKNINHQPSTISHQIAAVQGYQWHVLNKSENWITRGVRSEYAGSYVIERSGREIYGALKQISGAVYMIRRDVLEEVGWETSITEDFQLTLKLYEKGYKVVFTPYIQAPAECVSTLKRLIRQRMRWAEGHSNNIRRMFVRLMFGRWEPVNSEQWTVDSELKNTKHRTPSGPKALRGRRPYTEHKQKFIPSPLTLSEKLEFLYLSPYYLQAFFFLVGTISWLISETLFPARLPFWTQLWGWSLVLTNLISLPLMNAVGLFLEESEERDYLGIASFFALSYIVVPFQAYASLKGFFKGEGPWFRTPKTGRITDVIARGKFYRFISGILPGRVSPSVVHANNMRMGILRMDSNKFAQFKFANNSHYLSLATANNQFNSFTIKTRKGKRWIGKLLVVILLTISTTLASLAPGIASRNIAEAKGFGTINQLDDNANNNQKRKLKEARERNIEQDFSWGVLAINTNKSIYLPGEIAKLDMAVLDDEGKMVCDASLYLVISHQSSVISTLSTEDGTIKVNPECQKYELNEKPDFEAEYQVKGAGEYQMSLTAETANDSYTVTDSFEVREFTPFDIERNSATRIYPPETYPVSLVVTANQDFEGEVVETVPGSFKIIPDSRFKIQDSRIMWQVDWEKGETYELGYEFKAPNESPEFYMLGPVRLVPRQSSGLRSGLPDFSEIRQWQLAIDGTANIVPNAPDISTDWTPSTGTDHWALIDEGTTPVTTDYISAPSGSLIDQFNMTSFSIGGGNVSQIQVWLYASSTKAVEVFATLYWTDGNSETQNITMPVVVYDWVSTTFTGLSLSQGQLDSLAIRIQNDTAGGRATEVTTLYAAVTYPTIDITGNAYADEAGTPTVWTGCGTYNVSLSVNAGTKESTSCDGGTGAFSFTVPQPSTANQVIAVFFDTDGGDQAVLYTKNNDTSTNITGLTPTKNRVWIQSESAESISNANIDIYDKTQDTDIPAASDGTVLTVDAGVEIHINTDDTFAPGGAVTVANLHIEGTYSGSSETLTLNGSGTGVCTTEPGTIRPLCIEGGNFASSSNTTSFEGTTDSNIEATTYNVLQFNPASGTPTFYLNSGTVATSSNFTITGAANAVVDAETYDPAINIDGNFSIGSGDTFQASSIGSFNIQGDFSNSGIFTANSSTVVMDGTSGSITGTTNTSFSSLTIDPSSTGTITVTSSDPAVSGTLIVADTDTLSISASRTLTHTGATMTLSGATGGTISGDGTLRFTNASGGPGSDGTISCIVRYDASAGNVASTTFDARTYFGRVEIFSNSATARSVAFASGTYTISGVSSHLYVIADGVSPGDLTLDGSNDPTVTIDGDLDFTGAGTSSEAITSGIGTWTVSGNVNFTDGTYTATSGNTLKMDGDSKTITSASQTLDKFEVSGGSVSMIDALNVDGTFDVSAGSFTQGANVDLNVEGTFTLANGGSFNAAGGTGTVIFDGTTSPINWIDYNGTLQNIGVVSVNGTSKTVNLGSSVEASSVFIDADDALGLGSSTYTLTLTGSGTGSSRPLIVSGTLDEGSDSLVKFTGTAATEIEDETYHNLELAPTGSSPEYTLGTAVSQTITTNGYLIIGDDTNGVTVRADTYNPVISVTGAFTLNKNAGFTGGSSNMTVIGDFTLDGPAPASTYTYGAGTLIFDGGIDASPQYFEDLNSTKQNMGTVQVGTSPAVTKLNSDMTAESLTVTADDKFYTRGYDLDITTFITVNGTLDCTDDKAGDGTDINLGTTWTVAGTGVFIAEESPLPTDVIFDEGTGGNIDSGGVDGDHDFYNFAVTKSGAATMTLLAAIKVKNNLEISNSNSTLDVGTNYGITIGGNFTNNGTFTAQSGTVTFDDNTQTSTLLYSAAISFFNLTVLTAAKAMVFDNVDQTNVTGTLTINGGACVTMVTLRSDSDGDQFELNATAESVQYADVKDSNAITAISADNSKDITNNTGWTFSASICGSNADNLSSWSFQRKTFESNGEIETYWRFSYDNANSQIDIEYNQNPWDTGWSSDSSLSEDSSDFSVWENNTNVYIAYTESGDVKVRKGDLGETSITWDTTGAPCTSGECTALSGSTTTGYQYAFISQDTSGYLWVIAQYYDGTNYYMRAVRSTSADDLSAWDTIHDISSTTSTDANTYGVIIPTGSQDMYAIWIRGTAIEGRHWDNDAVGDEWDPDKGSAPDSIATGKSGLASNISAAADTSNNVHLVYIDGSSRVQYLTCGAVCSGTFGSSATLDTTATNEYVTVSIDTASDDVYAIWLRSSTAYYNYYTDSWQGETDTAWDEGDSPQHLTSNYGDPGMIFAEWTSGAAAPYTLNWDYIIIPERLWLWFGFAPILPLLLKRKRRKKATSALAIP